MENLKNNVCQAFIVGNRRIISKFVKGTERTDTNIICSHELDGAGDRLQTDNYSVGPNFALSTRLENWAEFYRPMSRSGNWCHRSGQRSGAVTDEGAFFDPQIEGLKDFSDGTSGVVGHKEGRSD